MSRPLASPVAALLLAAALLSSSAGAQTTPRAPNEPPERPAAAAPAPTDSAVVRAKAASRESFTYASLSAAMSTLPDQSTRFAQLREVRPEHIVLVDVRNLFRRGDEQKSYEQALEQYGRQIVEMRNVLQGSAALRGLLKDRGLNLSHVIGMQTGADGRAVVFYQPE